MSRGSDGEKQTLEEMGVSKENIQELTIKCLEREQEQARKYLVSAFEGLNKTLTDLNTNKESTKKEKIDRCSLSDLAAKVSGLANTVSGLLNYHVGREEQANKIMSEVVEVGRDVVMSAIEARYRIKILDIIIKSQGVIK